MSFLDFLFSFQGRVRRRDMWIFFLVLGAIYGGLFWQFGHWHAWHHDVDINMRDHTDQWVHHSGVFTLISHNPFFGLLGLAAAWAKLAVLVKRWHDRDKSGWWILIILIPFIGWLWQLIECGFMEGTQGPNRFGPSPKGE